MHNYTLKTANSNVTICKCKICGVNKIDRNGAVMYEKERQKSQSEPQCVKK